MVDYSAIQRAVIEGDDVKTVQLVKKALQEGMNPADIVTSGLQVAMTVVGNKFSSGEFFVPEMMLASRSVTRSLDVLQPYLADSDVVNI